jgi:hypothetical protein
LPAGATSVDQRQSSVPDSWGLNHNYPNPFNPSTTIGFQLPAGNHVQLKVYNMIGQEIATLVDESRAAGAYTVRFDASGLPSGVYLYRLTSGSFTETKTMELVK